MGQYWELVDLDTMESFGHMGKLGEFYWDELEHGYLIERIGVRPFPPKPKAKHGEKSGPSSAPVRSSSS